MAVREFKKRRYREQRKQSRRDLIARTARIWTRLYRETTHTLKAITGNWLKKFLKQAQQEIASGYVSDIQELPSQFTQTLERTLRQALAQGYWLNHVYVQELRHSQQGMKYHGRIKLSDKDEEEKLIDILQAFMNEEVSDEWQEVIPESAVNWLKDYVPKLAGVLSEDVLERTREVIRGSMMTGSTLQERMKALRESSDVLQRMTDARIETIARTEITRADSMGRLIEMKGNDDVIGVEFSAIMDDRTTEMCAERHGLVMRLDDPRLPENTPPLHVNCVLGDTFVLPIGGVSALSERVFNGDIFVIESAGGNYLAGTPNHPILTSRGWIPLSEIKKGDYVVCDSIGERGNIINGEHQQMIARIKDAASAFFDNGEMFSAPVPMTAEDFHHDGGQSNVAVIYTDRKLLDRMKSFTNEQIIEQRFIFRDVIRSFLKYCNSVLFFSLKRVRFPSFCFMSFLCKFQSFFKRSVLHSCKLLFMSIARLYAMFDKNAPDCIRCCDVETDSNTMHTYTLIMQSDDSFMVNGIDGTFPLNAMFEQNIINRIVTGAIFFAKFHNAESREIIFDNVVSVEQRRFNGHVYNLQTESGIFVANNIITHNCRSMLLSLTVYDYPDGLLTSHEFDEVPSGIQRETDIEEFRKILDSDLGNISANTFSTYEVSLSAGALNDYNDPKGQKRRAHAKRYYETLRRSKAEPILSKLSKNSGISLKSARKVYEHVFINEYVLYDGEVKRFDPSYDMAESFRRLLSGEKIQEHDIILVHHERLEYELMNRYKKDYDTAHRLTCRKYDYYTALKKWKKERGE